MSISDVNCRRERPVNVAGQGKRTKDIKPQAHARERRRQAEEERFLLGGLGGVAAAAFVWMGAMAEPTAAAGVTRKESNLWKMVFSMVRIMTTLVTYGVLQASKQALDPVAPVYKYCLVSISNILTTTCQYEALKYVSFPVQTLAKCTKMILVMVWGTLIMQKIHRGHDYLLAF